MTHSSELKVGSKEILFLIALVVSPSCMGSVVPICSRRFASRGLSCVMFGRDVEIGPCARLPW